MCGHGSWSHTNTILGCIVRISYSQHCITLTNKQTNRLNGKWSLYSRVLGCIHSLHYIRLALNISYTMGMNSRLFHRTTNCQGDTYTGKNLVPPIKTRSPVVKAVKLMACRQAQSPLKITT